jgi:hypothetical protein
MIAAYSFILAASPHSSVQTLIDLVLLGGLALLSGAQAISMLINAMTLNRFLPRESAAALQAGRAGVRPAGRLQLQPQPTGGFTAPADASSAESVSSSGDVVSSAARLVFRTSAEQVASARRAFRIVLLFLSASLVCSGCLLLSVVWSNMYSASYQSYILFVTACEVASFLCMLTAAHAALTTQREQLQHFGDLGIAAEVQAKLPPSLPRTPSKRERKVASPSPKRNSSISGRHAAASVSVSSSSIVGSRSHSQAAGSMSPKAGSIGGSCTFESEARQMQTQLGRSPVLGAAGGVVLHYSPATFVGESATSPSASLASLGQASRAANRFKSFRAFRQGQSPLAPIATVASPSSDAAAATSPSASASASASLFNKYQLPTRHLAAASASPALNASEILQRVMANEEELELDMDTPALASASASGSMQLHRERSGSVQPGQIEEVEI